MKAAITPNYGPADILETTELPTPTIGADEVLVEIHASPVTAGDCRLRAADFPAISVVPGRLMMGVLRPRHRVQGSMFAGRIVAIGDSVTRYAVGDDVFGSTDGGAYAEYLAVAEIGPMAKMTAGMSYAEAAEVPYGGVTALRFLRDMAQVTEGDRVLILGASGGVGRYAVQIAKHLGAEVTGVASGRNLKLVRELGADHAIDYRTEDWSRNGEQYDVIFDIADTTTFGEARRSLSAKGRFLTLFMSVGVMLLSLLTSITRGPRAMFGIALGERQDMVDLAELVTEGAIRPIVAEQVPLARIAEAHELAERGLSGGVLVTMRPAAVSKLAAVA